MKPNQTMNRKKAQKPYWEMNLQELEEATKDLDQEFIIDKFREMTPAERRQWERARRKVAKKSEGKAMKTRETVKTRMPTKPYWEMNLEELREATREFDESMVILRAKKPTKKDLESLARMRRKVGRPRKGQGAKVVFVSIERCLLSEADALAVRLKITRAELIARGLKKMVAAKEKHVRQADLQDVAS